MIRRHVSCQVNYPALDGSRGRYWAIGSRSFRRHRQGWWSYLLFPAPGLLIRFRIGLIRYIILCVPLMLVNCLKFHFICISNVDNRKKSISCGHTYSTHSNNLIYQLEGTNLLNCSIFRNGQKTAEFKFILPLFIFIFNQFEFEFRLTNNFLFFSQVRPWNILLEQYGKTVSFKIQIKSNSTI